MASGARPCASGSTARRSPQGRLTVADIEGALRRENVELPAGRLESSEREFSLRTDTGLSKVEDFRKLSIGRGADGYLVRLGDVARVELGAENERSVSRSTGLPGISLGIEQNSKANTLEVAKEIYKTLDRIRPGLPAGMSLSINIDRADSINASLHEVVIALGISMTVVLLVIFLFLGNLRATLVPAVTIPISIIATFMVMDAMDYSINVLTLLGLVLAIGLVVDDAIVVLENIFRRVEEGQPPLLAAIDGSREIGFAVIATTLVLISVFVPISFLPGSHRPAVPRIRLHAGGSRAVLGARGADADAGDGDAPVPAGTATQRVRAAAWTASFSACRRPTSTACASCSAGRG